MLCLIPFDICSIDSTMSLQTKTNDASSMRHEHQSKLVLDMISICKEHLSESGPTREAGYACLSALFTRPDMEASILSDFMTWGCSRLRAWADKGAEAERELNKESFQLIGLLHCLSQIFKKGHRNNLLPFAAQVLEPCLLITEQPNQTLVRKLLVKVCQRIALTFLPPREAAWRYQRGSRSLLQNLQQSIGQLSSTAPVSLQAEEEEDDIEIPEEMEEIVEKLLTSLRDKDTVVRWSAAKGIGRITMRLPQGFGDDVVGAVISIFDDPEADSAWHGGCLALAELSRRGLLLPSRLDTVVPLVVSAMHFDQIRGQHRFVSSLRDSPSGDPAP
jgi:tubulin-specific chaperone D